MLKLPSKYLYMCIYMYVIVDLSGRQANYGIFNTIPGPRVSLCFSGINLEISGWLAGTLFRGAILRWPLLWYGKSMQMSTLLIPIRQVFSCLTMTFKIRKNLKQIEQAHNKVDLHIKNSQNTQCSCRQCQNIPSFMQTQRCTQNILSPVQTKNTGTPELQVSHSTSTQSTNLCYSVSLVICSH